MAAPKEPFASICDISSFPTAGKSNSQPTSRIGHARSAAEAHGALGAENNFAHRKPGQDLGVEPTAPGGVPPSPQPLTHPAIRPWPFWPGSSFLGGQQETGEYAAASVLQTNRAFCPALPSRL